MRGGGPLFPTENIRIETIKKNYLATRLDMPIKCIFWKPVEMLLGNHAKESYHLVPADSGFSLQPPASPDSYFYPLLLLI